MENADRFAELVLKSNLVATAGEFVPKSQANLEAISRDQVARRSEIFMGEGGSFGGSSCGSFSGDPVEPTSGPSTSRSQHVRWFFGDPRNSMRPFSRPSNERGQFCQGEDFRHPRPIQNRVQNKSKRPDWNDDSVCGKPSHDKGRPQLENIQYNKLYSMANTKPKWNEPNHWTREKHSRFNGQSESFGGDTKSSWRRSSDRPARHQTYSKYRENHAVNKLKQVSSNEDEPSAQDKFGNAKKSQIEELIVGSGGPPQANRREQLVDLLMHGTLECLVCCEFITQHGSVWSCSNCYHVLHLRCVIKWAKSSKSNFGWRCPACQNITEKIPQGYYCFCGKVRDPEWNHQDCPHSCGEVCGKSYRKGCPHKCTLLCHPGPCPQCTATVTKTCGCQRTAKTLQCFSSEEVVCGQICGRELTCLSHTCMDRCHLGECEECNKFIEQDCFCKKNHRQIKCSVEALISMNYSCGNPCGKKLNCGNHFCQVVCHEGDCPPCELTPEKVKHCACGQTELTALNTKTRKSCLDPVPTCSLICGKSLTCGPSEKRHVCQSECHEGDCPECSLETTVKCRCGHKNRVLPCRQLNTGSESILCDKRCTKKRTCGKHKCNQMCCTGVEHECSLPCNRFLACGLHRCEETCHRGHCKPCLQASFEELSCECGAEVIFPPVPCGTRRPPCERPCTRTHDCDHPPVHSCHSAQQCPPCTVLTKKYCHGRHELRKAVPCHMDSFSCGLPCGKDLDCGRHKCILPCHSDPCLQADRPCSQPCTVLRSGCGHICGMPCHEGPCSFDFPCKETVRVTCECGRRFTTQACHENTKEFQRIATAKLASKMADLQAGQKIDLNDVAVANKKFSYKTLECDDECKLVERNRRLALALQIKNPDLSAKLTPRYSDYLKNWAKRDPRFCQMVHDKLTDLVHLAKQSKQKSRSFSFDPMNREKRHFVHEYCEHFGCESVAYDQEPKRNVVATALKEKSWLPSVSIIEFIQKENSPRKVPVPVISKSATATPQRAMEVLSRKTPGGPHQSDAQDHRAIGHDSQIDYFDWRPQNE